jgi:hypothetical protein
MGNRGLNVNRFSDLIEQLQRRDENIDRRLTALIEFLNLEGQDCYEPCEHSHEIEECYAPCGHTHDFPEAGGSFPEVVIVASDASDKWQAVGDYFCDGTDDDVQIQEALDFAATIFGFDTGVSIRFSDGSFNSGAPRPTIVIPSTGNGTIRIGGSGRGVTEVSGFDFQVNAGEVVFSDMLMNNTNIKGGLSVGQLYLSDIEFTAGEGIDYTTTNDALIGVARNCSFGTVEANNLSGWSMYNCTMNTFQVDNDWDFGNRYVGCSFLELILNGVSADVSESEMMFLSCFFEPAGDVTLIGAKDGDFVKNNVTFQSCVFGKEGTVNVSRDWSNLVFNGNVFISRDVSFVINTASYERMRQFSFTNNICLIDYYDITPLDPTYSDFYFQGIEHPVVTGNRFFARHITFDNCTAPMFSNNMIEGWEFTASGDPGVVRGINSSDLTITNNTFLSDGFTNPDSAAVYLDGDTVAAFIDGNTYDKGMGFDANFLDWGILIESGAVDVRIGTNSWTAATSGILSDAGTATVHWLLDREAPIPLASDDGLAIKYELTGDKWILGEPPSPASPASPTSPGAGTGSGAQITGAYDIETPGTYTDAGMSDEFASGTLDGQWTTISGTVGSVTYANNTGSVSMTATPGTGLYDLSTRPGTLLFQSDYTDQFAAYQSTIPSSGEQIIVSMLIPEIPSFANNAFTAGISFTSSTSSPESGTYARCYYDGSDVGAFKLFDGSTLLGSVEQSFAPGRWYMRAIRANSNIYFYVSRDGTIWAEVGVKPDTSMANFWIFMGHYAVPSALGIAPIGGFNWVRHVANTSFDPWPSDS